MTPEKIQLLRMKIDILKLKADDHDWQCYVPDNVKLELENALVEIDKALEESR